MDTPVRARARRSTKPIAKTTKIVAKTAKEVAEVPNLDLRSLLRALQSVRDGDFSVRLASDQTGLAGKVADTFNEIVSSNQRLASELERAGQIVGKDGKTRHRVASDRRSCRI